MAIFELLFLVLAAVVVILTVAVIIMVEKPVLLEVVIGVIRVMPS